MCSLVSRPLRIGGASRSERCLDVIQLSKPDFTSLTAVQSAAMQAPGTRVISVGVKGGAVGQRVEAVCVERRGEDAI